MILRSTCILPSATRFFPCSTSPRSRGSGWKYHRRAQPKTANALIRRVINKGAELLSLAEARDNSAATMLAPIRKGEQVIGVLFIQNRDAGRLHET